LGKEAEYEPGELYLGFEIADIGLHLEDGADHIGAIEAWNLATGGKVWTYEHRGCRRAGAAAGYGRRSRIRRWRQRPDHPGARRRHR
jgi:hypothetical protein